MVRRSFSLLATNAQTASTFCRSMPPPPELQSLGRMVDLGEVTAIREWAQQLRRDYPQCTDFADRIEQAINMLDFKSIESLLGRASR